MDALYDFYLKHRPPSKPSIFVLTALSTIFSILVIADCSFMMAARQEEDDVAVGLFSRMIYDVDNDKLGCVSYTDKSNFDSLFRAGRAFGVLTALLTCTSLILLAAPLLMLPKHSTVMWWTAQYGLMASTVTQMFTFFALGSNWLCVQHDCYLTGVGVLAAFNVIILSGLSIALYLEPPPTQPWFAWWEQDDQPAAALDPAVAEYLAGQRPNPSNKKSTIDHKIEVEGLQEVKLPPELQTGRHENDDDDSSIEESIGIQQWRIFRLVVFGFFVFAWAVTIAGVERCTFVLVGPEGGERSKFSGVGLYTRAVYDDQGMVQGCIRYPAKTKAEFDGPFHAGRVFGAITSMLMTVILLIKIWLLFFNIVLVEAWIVIRMLLPFATLSQLIVFVVYRTETCSFHNMIECVPGQLGIWVVLNVILMVILCTLVYLMPPPAHPIFARVRHETANDTGSNSQRAQASAQPQKPMKQPKKQKAPVVDPSSLKMVGKEAFAEEDDRTAVASHMRGHHHDDDDEDEIVRIVPPDQQSHYNEAELITVQVEYTSREKKIIKTITHPDGARTITTTIEELSDSGANDGEDFDDESMRTELDEVAL